MGAVETHIRQLIHFNHAPPLRDNPFYNVNDATVEKNGNQVCVVDFFENTKSIYQLRTVAKEGLELNETMVMNHEGPCGVCSSLSDFLVFMKQQHGTSIVKIKKCRLIGYFSRDWGVECFRVHGFSAPCAELIYWKTMFSMRQCLYECFGPKNSERCDPCLEAAGLEVFEHFAGRHFNLEKQNKVNVFLDKLPMVRHDLVEQAEAYRPPQYGADFIRRLRMKKCLNPPERPSRDPYYDPEFNYWSEPGAVCGAKFNPPSFRQYTLQSYASKEAATNDGAVVTHLGECGYCSSLEDFAVYVEHRDLTTPVRRCGLLSFLSKKWGLECLYKLGFTKPCADIWFFNTQHTRARCQSICLRHIFTPNNKANGKLNPCILCDEEMSGPVFKRASARTRRNSGLHSAIKRPGPSLAQLDHNYPETDETCADNEEES